MDAATQTHRAVLSSITDGVMVLGPSGIIIDANPAACRMHGWQDGSLCGVPMRDLVSPASLPVYTSLVEPNAEPNTRPTPLLDGLGAHVIHVHKNGSPVDIEARSRQLHTPDGPRILLILTDVTERNRAAQRLESLSRKALMAQEEERARVARDLHDELGQLLTASRIELGWLEKQVASMPEDAVVALHKAIQAVEKAADELRRICRGLRPPLLDDLGLEPAIRLLAHDQEERTGVFVNLSMQVNKSASLTSDVSLCTYRVLQESLNNISRHAGASCVHVSLTCDGSELLLSVCDNGIGFDVGALPSVDGLGIAGMRERASLAGGLVEIRSVVHAGTQVVMRIPLTRAAPEVES